MKITGKSNCSVRPLKLIPDGMFIRNALRVGLLGLMVGINSISYAQKTVHEEYTKPTEKRGPERITIAPAVAFGFAPKVTAYYYDDAWVHDPRLRFDETPDQREGFPSGQEDGVGRGVPASIWHGNPGQPRAPVVPGQVNVQPGGMLEQTFRADVVAQPNEARAWTLIGVQPFAGNRITADIQLHGSVTATVDAAGSPNPSDAYAFTYGEVTAQATNLVNGEVILIPGTVQTTHPRLGEIGTGKEMITKDPVFVNYSGIDLITGESFTGSLFWMELALFGGGTIGFDDTGLLTIDADDGEFLIDMTSPFLRDGTQGNLHVKMSNGIVSLAEDSGIFSGLLPKVGDPSVFALSLPILNASGEIHLDYDLRPLFGHHEANVEISAGLAEGAYVSVAVPEPSAIAISGSLICLLAVFSRRFRVRV